MLVGYKKKLVRDTISFFIDTTGLSSEQFIVSVQHNNTKDLSTLCYTDWLAVKSYRLLKDNDISLADCLEFRNLTTQLKLEKKGMHLSSVWKKEISSCIEATNISQHVLFELSDKNSELCNISSNEVSFFDFESIDINFFNTFDFDSYNKTLFNILPSTIQTAILYDKPIFINMNPYLEYTKNIDLLLDEMKLYGFNTKCLLNIFYGSIFRLIRFSQEYNLTNLRIGFFTNLDMFYENAAFASFYTYFKQYFKFTKGICFNPKSVGVKGKEDFIGYCIWDLKKSSSEKNNPVVLDERIQHTDDTILCGNSRLLRGKKDSIYDWVLKGTITNGVSDKIPLFLNLQTKSTKQIERYDNVLGYQLNTPNLLRSLKKVGIFSVPMGEYTEITTENFYKSVASYAVRSCLVEKVGLTPIFLNTPDTDIVSYSSWLSDALVLFLFNTTNMTKSYREKDLVLVNRLFPLSSLEVMKYISDSNIINDMELHNADNTVFLSYLDSVLKYSSTVGAELFTFCKKKIIESLLGKVRENVGYKDSLVAWDASFYQIRSIEKLFTPKEEERYNYLVSKLKEKLYDGIYKYGFISLEN